MIARDPDAAAGWKVLGLAFKLQGRDADALDPLLRAAELAPDEAEAQYNAALVLHTLGRADEAEPHYRDALRLDPVHERARLNLGALYHAQGRYGEAEVALREALRIRPDHARAHASLGAVLLAQGQLAAAEASCRCALDCAPCDAAALDTLGAAALRRNCPDEAEARFREALLCDPTFMPAQRGLARALLRQKRLAEAEAAFRAALRLAPDDAAAHAGLGDALRACKRLTEAESAYRTALETCPDDVETCNSLGLVLNEAGRPAEALALFEAITQTHPGNPGALSNLAQALLALGRTDEAEVRLREALDAQPDNAALHSNLLYLLTLARDDADAVAAEHLRYAARFETPQRAAWRAHGNVRDPERRLRVGFVSADLYAHAVASFLAPILPHLAAQPGLELYAYSCGDIDDEISRSLRAGFAHWRDAARLDDDALADAIRADGIDVLIDLSGHTAGNRLPMFARKPAPVQASWIGYPNTTGLSTIDYYLCDRGLLPPGLADARFSEKLARLYSNAAFQPYAASPPVNPLPALKNGYPTFGSFNRANKINRETVALWSRLLRAVPEARLLLGGVPPDEFRAAFAAWFEAQGVAASRIEPHPRCDMAAYLALHHQVDLCLDTFPYNGGTTTHHALWMGVPTLTVAGQSARDRVGVAILSQVGLERFAAADVADFVARGVHWASQPDELAALRAGLRARIAAAPARLPETVAAGLTQALRVMWRRWCAALPPASFGQSLDEGGSIVTLEETA